jgi:hypothetical protein
MHLLKKIQASQQNKGKIERKKIYKIFIKFL